MNLVSMQQDAVMSSRAIAELVGSNHSDVKRSIKRLEVDQLLTTPLAEFDFEHNGNIYQEYHLNKRDSILCVARISPAFTAAIIDRWQELENQIVRPVVVIPQNYKEALLALIHAEEVKEQLTIERDTAIATKAQISDRKTATALNTASQAVKRANKLESEIGRCINHATILAVRNAIGTEYAWQPLRKYCKAFDINTNVVHDERYGKVKSYPARAWMAVHGVDINGLFGE